jgi:hypothetical protein
VALVQAAATPLDPAEDQVAAHVKVDMQVAPEAEPVPVVVPVEVRAPVVAPVVLAVQVGQARVGAPAGSVDHRAGPAGGVDVATKKSCNRNT